jgi:hypothetical protein
MNRHDALRQLFFRLHRQASEARHVGDREEAVKMMARAQVVSGMLGDIQRREVRRRENQLRDEARVRRRDC